MTAAPERGGRQPGRHPRSGDGGRCNHGWIDLYAALGYDPELVEAVRRELETAILRHEDPHRDFGKVVALRAARIDPAHTLKAE